MRISSLANYDRWAALDQGAYGWQKLQLVRSTRCVGRSLRARLPQVGGRYRHVHARPRSSASRATTGAPSTARSKSVTTARTHLHNLYLCGTDQGLVGIVGSIISGILNGIRGRWMVNRYLLKGHTTPAERSMPKDPLLCHSFVTPIRDCYDVIVIGAGLAGLTAANVACTSGPPRPAAGTAQQARRAGHLVPPAPADTSSTSRCTGSPSA